MNFGDESNTFGLWVQLFSIPLTHCEVAVVLK